MSGVPSSGFHRAAGFYLLLGTESKKPAAGNHG